jgi:hypothetical protein
VGKGEKESLKKMVGEYVVEGGGGFDEVNGVKKEEKEWGGIRCRMKRERSEGIERRCLDYGCLKTVENIEVIRVVYG